MTKYLQRDINYCKFEMKLRDNEIDMLKGQLEGNDKEITNKYKKKNRDLKEQLR